MGVPFFGVDRAGFAPAMMLDPLVGGRFVGTAQPLADFCPPCPGTGDMTLHGCNRGKSPFFSDNYIIPCPILSVAQVLLFSGECVIV
jgi:hypothetical protein